MGCLPARVPDACPRIAASYRCLDLQSTHQPGKRNNMIRYTTECPDPAEYFSLFETTGWNGKYAATQDELASAVRHSWLTVSALDGDHLVASGRVVSDGVLYAMIYDMIVRPEYQRRGIGSELLTRLVAQCRSAGIRDIQLFSAAGKVSFYERHDFQRRPDEAPGMRIASATPCVGRQR